MAPGAFLQFLEQEYATTVPASGPLSGKRKGLV
jgi:hypothetical protein